MERKRKIEIAVIFILFLGIACYMEFFQSQLEDGTRLRRGTEEEGAQEIELIVNAGDVLSDYSYEISVEKMKPTSEEAAEYFAKAKEEIDANFCREGEELSHVTQEVCVKESYVNGIVSAEWTFDNYHVIDPDGTLIEEGLTEEGVMVGVQVELSCDIYSELYIFSFMAYPRELSSQEKLLQKIGEAIAAQQEKRGEEYITLPDEIEGTKLLWTEARSYLVLKVLLLEGIILILLPMIGAQKKKQEEKERNTRLLLDYPDMVSKLAVLVGSGMSVKQAWNRISARYYDERQKKQAKSSPLYEEMLKTRREIEDGESERAAYERFGDRTGLYSYHRFVRLLVQNLQKGTRNLSELLRQETETAFEERRLLARKLGEEAGTKMLFPLMLMRGIVMAIVIMPAMIGFME